MRSLSSNDEPIYNGTHMVTPELLDFLHAQLSAGVSVDDAMRMLVEEGGWESADVEEGLRELGVLPPLPAVAVPMKPAPREEPEARPEPILEHGSTQAEESLSPAPLPETRIASAPPVLPSKEEAPVVLSVRSDRSPAEPHAEDFLGIFTEPIEGGMKAAESAPSEVPAPVATPASAPSPVAPVSVAPKTPSEEPSPFLPPLAKRERAEPEPSIVDMLLPVTAPEVPPSVAPVDPATPPPIANAVEAEKKTEPVAVFAPPSPQPSVVPATPELSPHTPIPPAASVPIVAPAPPVAVPPPAAMTAPLVAPPPAPPVATASASPSSPPLSSSGTAFKFDLTKLKSPDTAQTPSPSVASSYDKPVETRPLSEVWAAHKSEARETSTPAPQSTPAVSAPQTADVLLRGLEAKPSSAPKAIVPMAALGAMLGKDATPAPKAPASPKLPLTKEEQDERKRRIKKVMIVAGGAVAVLASAIGGVLFFLSMRGPDVGSVLTNSLANFVAASTFAYSGTVSSDIVLTTKTDDEERSGAVKFALGVAGQLRNDRSGYGDGNHHFKWSGGLQSGTFTWSSDVESDVRLIGSDLYFHVLSFPAQADLDPELFKQYWIKVDVAEIGKEIALDTLGGEQYGGIASADSSSFNAIFMKHLPFIGGELIGEETVANVPAAHYRLTTDSEKMYSLMLDLYAKYTGKTLAPNQEEKVRLLGALSKVVFEVWVDEKTSSLVEFKLSADLDDDFFAVHAKGPIELAIQFAGYGGAFTTAVPSPYLSLDELQVRMEDSRKLREIRNRDAVRVSGILEIERSLEAYLAAKGRYPTVLADLRVGGYLSTTTLADELLKTYSFASYVSDKDLSKVGRCTAKSKACAFYHLGTNFDDPTNPVLSSDADLTSDVHGADGAGCSLEREKSCYDVVFPDRETASSTPPGN